MLNYNLEKWIWTDNDFEKMNWHDSPIYAMQFDDNVLFDMDYIFKWDSAEEKGMPYTFWISPVTMIFKEVSYLKVDFILDFINGLEISIILREDLKETSKWTIETQEGSIEIHAKSFRQIVRKRPTFQFHMFLEERERNGVSLSTESDKTWSQQEQHNQESKLRDYELLKEIYAKRNELSEWLRKKSTIETKKFILTKRMIEDKITELANQMNNKELVKF